jgi:hypothetical protein
MDKLAKYPAVQAVEIKKYLEEGWIIDGKDPNDGQVLIHKGFSFRWIRPDGTSYTASKEGGS